MAKKRTKQNKISSPKKELTEEFDGKKQSISKKRKSLSNEQSDTEDTADYIGTIDNLLDSVESPGDFQVGNKLDQSIHPDLFIIGVGLIGLPLIPFQIEQIIKISEQAPFGEKDQTIVDTSIRNTWQLSPSQFQITNPKGLGVSSDIELHLYKLLLYEPGGFFKPHRDTEKEDKMFATLIIQLPTEHEGGQLVVKHKDKTRTFDFGGKESGFELYYAAFYADCEHEVLPVTSGYRLNLVYNVVYTGSSTVPSLLNYSLPYKICKLIEKWECDKNPSTPKKLVKMLDHKYTTVGFSFATLKGKDLAIANTLKKVEEMNSLKLFLGIVKINQSGYAEDHYNPSETFESTDTEISLINMVDTNNNKIPSQSADTEEILPRNYIDTLSNPDKEDFGATGNEGTTMERWYKRLALVFLPNLHYYLFLGVKAIASRLQQLVDQCGNPIDKSSLAYQEAVKFGNDTICKIFPSDIGESEQQYYDKILYLVASLDLYEPFEHMLEYAEDIPVDHVLKMAEKSEWTEFKSILISIVKNSTERERFFILAKCAGYTSAEDLKPIHLSGNQLELCRELTSELSNSMKNLNSESLVFMMKYLYIIDNIELANSFVTKILTTQPMQNLVVTNKNLGHWLGPLASSYLSYMMLANSLVEKVNDATNSSQERSVKRVKPEDVIVLD